MSIMAQVWETGPTWSMAWYFVLMVVAWERMSTVAFVKVEREERRGRCTFCDEFSVDFWSILLDFGEDYHSLPDIFPSYTFEGERSRLSC